MGNSVKAILSSKYGSFAAVALVLRPDCSHRRRLSSTVPRPKLLEADAEMVTDEWANYIVSNVPDLSEIAQGETPSNDSVIFFEQARQVGRVYDFSIYDPDGQPDPQIRRTRPHPHVRLTMFSRPGPNSCRRAKTASASSLSMRAVPPSVRRSLPTPFSRSARKAISTAGWRSKSTRPAASACSCRP